jgi:hypothetical protein
MGALIKSAFSWERGGMKLKVMKCHIGNKMG